MWIIGLPLTWFFVKRHRPEYYGLLPDGTTVEEEVAEASQMIDRGIEYAGEVDEVEFTLRQAMRTRTYWLLILGQAGHILAMQAITLHGVPFLTDIGIDLVKAAGILAIMSAVSIPTRFIGGFIADRTERSHLRFLIGGAYLLEAIAFAIFLLNQTIPMIFVWFIIYGIGFGASLTLTSYIRSRYFGRKAYGSIQGSSIMITTPIAMLAPIYLGWVHDTTGGYIMAFSFVTASLAFGAVVMFFTLPLKPPASL